MTTRPCFLVVDQEHASSISTRKLVLETAKYNVITAYSCSEATATLQRFPGVDAVVMNGATHDPNLSGFLKALAEMPAVKLVVVGERHLAAAGREPDAVVAGFDPPRLLETLRDLYPFQTRELDMRENELERKEI